MKLEEFILSQLYILGAVGIGIAFLQVKHRPLNKIQVQNKIQNSTCNINPLGLSNHCVIYFAF